jgi:hypothetical protein
MRSTDMGVLRLDGASPARLAALSRDALDRVMTSEAELVVAVPQGEAVVLGAFQRASEVTSGSPRVRRGSGGAAARVGPGSVWVMLALARPDALVACDAARMLNRYVRPILSAMTKSGALAHYFDRDWISVARRPAALVGFAHDASTGRALVEAVIAVSTPFATGERASFLGKAPTTLAEHAPAVDPARVADAIAAAYSTAYGRSPVPFAPRELERGAADAAEAARADGTEAEDDRPWTATCEEAIGTLAAGRDRTGRMRVGGELMASRDAMTKLEDALARGDDAPRAVDEALGAPGVVTFGVRSLDSIRDVIERA